MFFRTLAYRYLTFLAINNTIRSAPARQAAAILAVTMFVDATIRTIPQKAEPRSAGTQENDNFQRQFCMQKAT